MLRHIQPSDDPNLLIGFEKGDDAAVYRLSDEIAVVLTVDLFTPVVDDPYQYGLIAAANAFSDIYAKGGRPLLALNVAGFPRRLPLEILAEMLRGGADKAAEAGVIIVGGHTIDDAEPKYGLAVTGFVHPSKIVTNAGARPGDLLYLTKPLGLGVITTGIKQEKTPPGVAAEAVRVMETLNREASEAMLEAGAHACTDVTGFGLLGHLHEMVEAAGTGALVALPAVPVLDGARAVATLGAVAGAPRATWSGWRTRSPGTPRSTRSPGPCWLTRRPRAGCSSRSLPRGRACSRRRCAGAASRPSQRSGQSRGAGIARSG